MVKIWGGCIEPEGLELDDGSDETECPECGAAACSWHTERVDGGSLNTYAGLYCLSCDFVEGDHPGDWEP